MSAPSTAAPRAAASVIELEIAAEAGPGWLGSGAEPVTVSLVAETVRFEGAHLHFVTGNTVVRSVPRAEVTALTWRGSPPRGRGSGPYRNAGVVWTEEERARLTAEVLGDLSWIEISHRHERSISAVRREAVRMRLVDELGRRLDEQPEPGAALSPGATHSSGAALSLGTATHALPPRPAPAQAPSSAPSGSGTATPGRTIARPR
jgi:hypothetical protein